jgi:hypothetical protein
MLLSFLVNFQDYGLAQGVCKGPEIASRSITSGRSHTQSDELKEEKTRSKGLFVGLVSHRLCNGMSVLPKRLILKIHHCVLVLHILLFLPSTYLVLGYI